MATDNLSGVSEAIRKACDAYVQALTTVTKALQGLATQTSGPERDKLIENWLRVARMSKDGIITALDHGFEYWEKEIRRNAAAAAQGASSAAPKNPMDAWAENWRRATEAFTTGPAGSWSEEARKQAEAIQKTLVEGMKQWQRLWEPDKQ
ncbi:MAG: hypothetical protein ABSG46_17515 [Candidatus Binataceae bacterium]